MVLKPYYQHGGVTIYHGDCQSIMSDLQARSVDVVVTDPPYFLPAVHYNTRKEWPRSLCDVSILEHFYRDVFTNIGRVLARTGVAYVFCDGQSYPVFFSTAYAHFRKLRPLIWDKLVSFNGYSWRHQHELIMFAEMDEAPSVKTGEGDILRCRAVAIDSREHPAQKPLELLQRLVCKNTEPGGLVLDLFAGSGATLMAAARSGRSAIGIEREERYCEIAAKRLEQEVLPLEAAV